MKLLLERRWPPSESMLRTTSWVKLWKIPRSVKGLLSDFNTSAHVDGEASQVTKGSSLKSRYQSEVNEPAYFVFIVCVTLGKANPPMMLKIVRQCARSFPPPVER